MIAADLDQSRYAVNSYPPLAAYILRVPFSSGIDPRDWGLSADRHTDAVAWAKAINSVTPDLGVAIAESDLVQQMNKRATTCKNYHYVISFPAGEAPSREVLENIEDVLSASIGYREHQRIIAVHTDTAHLHMHVAINRVHPHLFHCTRAAFDHLALQRTTAQLEQAYQLVTENHEPFSSVREHPRYEPPWMTPPDQTRDPAADLLREAFAAHKHTLSQARRQAYASLRVEQQAYTQKLTAWHQQRRLNAAAASLNLGDRIATGNYLRDAAIADHRKRRVNQKQARDAIKQRFPAPTFEEFKLTRATTASRTRDAGHSRLEHETAGLERFADVPDFDPG